MPAALIYTPKIGDEIATLLGNDFTYDQIGAKLGFSRQTLIKWLSQEEDLRTKCASARTVQADTIEAKIAQIIEDVQTGILDPERARIVLAALQWRAAKKDPRKYGDKTILSNDPDNPITSLAVRLDTAITAKHNMIDVTPQKSAISMDDGSDLI